MTEEIRKPIVWVANRGERHDYSDAERFGTLVFLTEGRIRRFSVGALFEDLKAGLEDAGPEDYLILSSLSILTNIATAILVHKFGRVNYLMYMDGVYVERNIRL